MKRVLSTSIALLALWAIVAPVWGNDSSVDAEVVWAQSSVDEHEIRYAVFKAGEWQLENSSIYSSKRAVIAPFLMTTSDGGKILLWSEFLPGSRVILMLQRGQVTGESGDIDWFPPQPFADKLPFNSQAVAVGDRAGGIWVFWSGDTGSDSDIYQKYFNGRSWSNRELAHAPSEAPQYNPSIEVAVDGSITLSWLSYDASSLEFLAQQRLIEPAIEDGPALKLRATDLEAEIELVATVPEPQFLPPEEIVRLHFPRNKYQQNKVY